MNVIVLTALSDRRTEYLAEKESPIRPTSLVHSACLAICGCLVSSVPTLADDLTQWRALPGLPPAAVASDRATLQGGEWNYLLAPQDTANVELSATVTIENPATQFGFFGSSWSAWPDPKFEDRGFEAGLTVRSSADGKRGYRIQLSTKYQEVALIRFPDSGYVRSVPCPVKPQTPIKLRVMATGSVLRVFVDDQERIHYVDRLEPALDQGRVGVGAASGARVTFADVTTRAVALESTPAPLPHQPRFTFRRWLGGRWFVFDDQEPILQLHHPQDPSMFAKLRPGLPPQLTFDAHWGLENQGAFPDAAATWTEPEVSGGGETVRASWSARHRQERFTTHSSLVIGYDAQRATYTYDIDSELTVLPGQPFHFRYGFDFEHHTPLDPFRWQYLLIRDRSGKMTYRPLSPFDPGPLEDIETYQGLRVWHGRTGDVHRVSPAVEYRIQPEWIQSADEQGKVIRRQLNTAVCAAFYDTGVSFAPVTARPGDKLRVQYRYTGYPAEETAALFAAARVQDNPRIDPRHHFVFARDQWPEIRFDEALPLDKPWWGGRPFLSGHNARPTYGYVREGNTGCLRLGPVSYGVAPIGPAPIVPGRYLVKARVKSVNTHGPGGRIEVLALKKADPHGNGFVRMDAGNIVSEQTGYFGRGTFDWREVSLVAEVPPTATGLALGLGNAGTGEVLVSQVRCDFLGDQPPPAGLLSSTPPAAHMVPGALWDLRMQERQGWYVYNAGSSPHRTLELANIDWVEEDGRSAIRLADNPVDRADFPPLGILDQNLRHPHYGKSYAPYRHGAYAIGGHHGGGESLPGLTLAAWIRPAAAMGRSEHSGKGDIIGYGARRFILGLDGQTAPYSLVARINVNDRFPSSTQLAAHRWYHVALTAEPAGEHWRIRTFLDGQVVAEGTTKSLPSTAPIPDSLILGAELFYLHDAYYRGLLSQVLVLNRAGSLEEIRALARPTP
ncbi:MAG: LamG-like jellyroll fold domain-containing protein [Pirellulales bacterium]